MQKIRDHARMVSFFFLLHRARSNTLLFQLQQFEFYIHPRRKTCEFSIYPHHPVARHGNEQGITVAGHSHSARSTRVACPRSNLAICSCAAIRYQLQFFPHLFLEFGSLHSYGKGEFSPCSRKIFVEFGRDRCRKRTGGIFSLLRY